MKGILGRKAGMTSVFSATGQSIPVSVIEVQPNVVTNVLSQDKHGYQGIQLAAFDRRASTSTKPLVGHFKKAQTAPKYFVREIRNMAGFELGKKVTLDIFNVGELVDVTGTSKGKGFQGAIKRHNQKIGPKSHGGGGGSQPVRQTGSLGDLVSNRVFRGMTMPGHMGAETKTVQNLEIIAINQHDNMLLVKGSIPGPNKGFVIIKQAVKNLPAKTPIQLVDTMEAARKNELLEEAKKWGADINTDMTIGDMESAIEAAAAAHKAEEKAKAAHELEAKAKADADKIAAAAAKAHDDAEKAQKAGDKATAKEADAKAKKLDQQKQVATKKMVAAHAQAEIADEQAVAQEKAASKLQVKQPEPTPEPADQKSTSKADDSKPNNNPDHGDQGGK